MQSVKSPHAQECILAMKIRNSRHILSSSRPKMSLLAFLFFMLGSVDVYGRIQASQPSQVSAQVTPLIKLVLFGAIAAGMLEIGHFLI